MLLYCIVLYCIYVIVLYCIVFMLCYCIYVIRKECFAGMLLQRCHTNKSKSHLIKKLSKKHGK